MSLGHAAMDQVHMACVAQVNDLLTCSDDTLDAVLDCVVGHLEEHFGEEERQMRETTYNGASCHIEEHRAVLASAAEVRRLVRQGRTDIARSFAQQLAHWLPTHISNMDYSLADWLLTRRTDGQHPVRIFKHFLNS